MPRIVPLTRGFVCTISPEDWSRVRDYFWYAMTNKSGNTYAATNIPGAAHTLLMHRLLTNAPKSVKVDHKDGNGLNNVRRNLRLVSAAGNSHNSRRRRGTSRFKGVYWYKLTNRWHAVICLNYKRRSLGYYHDEEQAARAYDEAARKLHGAHACVNFPKEGERQA